MSGRAGIALVTIATALFTASSATADPVNTAPPVLSVTQGSNPVLTVSSGSWTTGTPPSKAAPLDVGSYDVQWQRCSYANAVVDHAPIAYYRLPGPAGHKSRYEDPAIEKLAEIAKDAKHKDATYVFTNVDMFADAKRFKKALKL